MIDCVLCLAGSCNGITYSKRRKPSRGSRWRGYAPVMREMTGAVSHRYRTERARMDHELSGIWLLGNALRTTSKQTAVMVMINALWLRYRAVSQTGSKYYSANWGVGGWVWGWRSIVAHNTNQLKKKDEQLTVPAPESGPFDLPAIKSALG